MPAPKTLKQAKAAYKSRAASANPLSEREQKQLERAAALDRRAWGLRQKDKARADAVKKRVEKDKAEREERRKMGESEEEQRRRDRHGFLASQLCLGAFFGRGGGGGRVGGMEGHGAHEDGNGEVVRLEREDAGKEQEDGKQGGEAEFDFGGDTEEEDFHDVDDESLLEILKSPEVQRREQPAEANRKTGAMPPPPPPRSIQAQQQRSPAKKEPIPSPRLPPPAAIASEILWRDLDFLDSSTQIARELDPTPAPKPPSPAPTPSAAANKPQTSHEVSPETPQQLPSNPKKADPCNTSFSSCGSFDLTEADLEELDPTPPSALTKPSPHTKPEKQADASMQPQPLPTSKPTTGHAPRQGIKSRAQDSESTMPPPELPAAKVAPRRPAGLPVKKSSSPRTSKLSPGLSAVLTKSVTANIGKRAAMAPPPPPPLRPNAQASRLPRQGMYRRGGKPHVRASDVRAMGDKENAFTISELESFVDEDLQLTQAC